MIDTLFRELICESCFKVYKGIFVYTDKVTEKTNICVHCKRHNKHIENSSINKSMTTNYRR